jgi:DedD protein
VQLGSFSARGNADALADRMREQGFEAFVQRVRVANGTMYRVRIGPVADRDDAESLAVRIREHSREPAVVVEHP